MIIQVTAEDIALGIRGLDDCCPIALAVRRAAGHVVKVGYFALWVDSDPMHLPDEAVDFVALFDTGQPVQPFEFELEAL